MCEVCSFLGAGEDPLDNSIIREVDILESVTCLDLFLPQVTRSSDRAECLGAGVPSQR